MDKTVFAKRAIEYQEDAREWHVLVETNAFTPYRTILAQQWRSYYARVAREYLFALIDGKAE